MDFWQILETKLQSQLGTKLTIQQKVRLAGGDINQVFKLLTSAGKFVIKINSASFAEDMFRSEALGLALLSQSKFIVPQTHLTGKEESVAFLVMEYIETGMPKPGYWETFGRQLAALHSFSNKHFGLETDNYIGSLPQTNKMCKDWATFYAKRRIIPQIKAAVSQHKLSSNYLYSEDRWVSFFQKLYPDEPPALLHGDLWSGNKMVSASGKPVLIDPAVYFGHREMDLSMMLLFGGFDKALFSAYQEVYPLEADWEKRVVWCQLYPLLVHANLFGGGYIQQVSHILNLLDK